VGGGEGRDNDSPQYCDACFSGDYPIRPTDMEAKGFKVREPVK
jgi:amidophosphoribosyltransferase